MNAIYATSGPIVGLIAPSRSNAQSEFAGALAQLQEEIRRHLLQSFTVRDERERLLDELEELRSAASYAGWDGYCARPISAEACEFVKTFIKALPTTAPLPELNVDPDGEVALDWSFGKHRALSVSIGPRGRCTFAWLLGMKSIRGTEWIEDEIPSSIVFAMRELDQAQVS